MVGFDGNFLLKQPGFAVVGLEGVLPGRKIIENEVSILICDREKRMLDDIDVGEFPWVDVAFETKKTFGLWKLKGIRPMSGQDGEILFAVSLRNDVNIVQGFVEVPHL